MSPGLTPSVKLHRTLCELKTPTELCRTQMLNQSPVVRSSTRLRFEDYIRRLFCEVFEARIRDAELRDVKAIMVCSRLPGTTDVFPVTEVTLDNSLGPVERAYVLIHLAGHLLQSTGTALVVVEPKRGSRAQLMATEAERTDHLAAEDVASAILDSRYVTRIWSDSDVRDGCLRWTPNHARVALASYLAGGLPYRPSGLLPVIERVVGRSRTRVALTRLRETAMAHPSKHLPLWLRLLLGAARAKILEWDVLGSRKFLWFSELLDARDNSHSAFAPIEVDIDR